MERKRILTAAFVAFLAMQPMATKADADPTSIEFVSHALSEEMIQLNDFLLGIEKEHEQIQEFILQYPGNPPTGFLLAPLKKLSKEQELEDFNKYFPMYKAAELKYGVPWLLLWGIHEHETTASRDPNTYNSLYHGAMQRSWQSWPERQTFAAAGGWEFLRHLPQRYQNDWREIMWAGHFIKRVSVLQYPHLPEDKGIIQVVTNNYSAEDHAKKRVSWYDRVKKDLEKFLS